MANYDAFLLSGYTTAGATANTGTLAAGEGKFVSGQTVVDTTGSVLGDETNDQFTSGGQTFQYVGVTTYTNTNGTGINAFVAEDISGTHAGSFYLFTPAATGDKPSIAQTITTTLDNTSSGSTQWNLTTNTTGCFVAGTLIATPTGAVAVETLAPGDLVLTADGAAMPVRWLGRSVVSRVFADPARVLPVRIKAGALDENVPARDLMVSPGHAVRVGDVLAHAGALVNGTSIVREQDAPLVFTYYHLELDHHALLLAEGAPAESFLEGIEDMGFVNLDERKAPSGEEMAYPRAKSPRQLPRAVQEHLAARATALFGAMAEAAD